MKLRPSSVIWKLLSTLTLAALLCATISSESLWTDEAFSAFLASHRSIAGEWSTLIHGDSSDLQMVLYYLYLHTWTVLFGESEVALRSANIPFIFLYAGVLVWASHRLFRSRWVWIIAALSPLAVGFAGDTRPYFDVIAMSLACTAMLLVYLQSPTVRERTILPWLLLLSMMVGALFHMLMLLLGPPLLVVMLVFYLRKHEALQWKDWKWPLLLLSPFGLALLAYFTWTFGRGVAYDYAPPDLLSMGSVIFRFVGLSGYAPNRHYDNPFRPYLFAMALSAVVFCLAIGAQALEWFRSDTNLCFKALFYALAVGLAEMVVFSFALHQQLEFRHLSSLLPLLLLMIMAGVCPPAPARPDLVTLAAALALGLTWLIGNIRNFASPEYQREDFKGAVRKCLQLQEDERRKGHNPVIAVAADPLGAAYYGVSSEGPAPCFPLATSCQQGLAQVDWPRKSGAQDALFWSEPQITNWLQSQTQSHTAVILLISRSRHPIMKNSPWWQSLATHSSSLYPQRGFSLYLLP